MTVSPMIEAWLFELRHRKSFHVPIVDLSDPYNKAMSDFQDFTTSIIDALVRKEKDLVKLLTDNLLQEFYSGFPAFRYASFRLWVKDATMKHPHRRWPKQHQFLAVVHLLNNNRPVAIHSVVLEAIGILNNFKERILAPGNLVKDPDALYFFRNKNGIKRANSGQDNEDNSTCPICTNDFDETQFSSQRAPCGHVLCKRCLDHWLLECKGTYTCPLCRACVVCSTNDCKHHVIHRDIARPIPMPKILDRVFPDKAGQVLHGIEPEQYWKARESTRGHRGLLAYVEQKLKPAIDAGDPVYARYVKDAEDILELVKVAVQATWDECA
jgi:hypothetical protein